MSEKSGIGKEVSEEGTWSVQRSAETGTGRGKAEGIMGQAEGKQGTHGKGRGKRRNPGNQ